MTIINFNNVDYTKEPIFLGQKLGIQRYDSFKYPKIYELYNKQLGFFWRPEEISLVKDRGDFKELSAHEQSIFIKNLSYQILLDSVQSRAIPYLVQNCSNPEFETCASAWQLFETIHSNSYTHIIKNIFGTPKEVFDNIYANEHIKSRALSVTKYYDALIEGMKTDNKKDLLTKIYLTLVSVNILEGIRFYVSFACSFAFAENKMMEGNAKIISLINRDENVHLAITQNLLKYIRNEESEGFLDIVKENEDTVIKMYQDAANEEIEWAEYIFKDGSMMGLNTQILTQYMKWLTNKRMSSIGVATLYGRVENPISWIKNWTESKDVQYAPQETEQISYRSSSVSSDMDKLDFKKYKL
jgi:ribonucleotide reductase beta subunit family protein with ferritin-like domain